MNNGSLTERWAKIIIDQLVQQGVEYFCLSPGSRSTPLALAVASHPKAKSMVHFDERGTAFHALGYAKGAKKPAAIIVTSGTAVGNVFPAVMEASFGQVPLILLTSDRPPELRDVSANQTADQVKIFGDQVRWQFDLPPPEEKLLDSFLGSTVAHAVYRSMHSPKGPVQLNCMFREPFFSSEKIDHDFKRAIHYEPSHSTLSSSTYQKWAKNLSSIEKGMIILGSMECDLEPIFELGLKLKWPILSDIISGARSYGEQEAHIAYSDLLLKTSNLAKPEFVLHLGDRIVSKTLAEFLYASKCSYCHVTDHPVRHDPKHQVTHRIECDPSLFCKEMLAFVSNSSSWLETWKIASKLMENQTEIFFSQVTELTEPSIVRSLLQVPKDWALFFSNSMPIRDADNFYFPNEKKGPIFANRGLSGIDGNIATAIGIARGSQRPTIAILGDQAALHDINSLPQVHDLDVPVLFVVINNKGGGIFSFLPVREKKEFLDKFFAAEHPYSFEKAASLFHLPYFQPSSLKDWEESLSSFVQKRKSALIEIETNREENYLFHQKIIANLKESCFLISAGAN